MEIIGKYYQFEDTRRDRKEELKRAGADKETKVLDLEEAMTEEDCEALRMLVYKVADSNMKVLEVGSWKGKSTATMGAVAKLYNGKVFAVDHWRGNVGVWNEEVAEAYDVFSIFRGNMELLGLVDTVDVLMMASVDAANLFNDNYLDLVFLDGDHRYREFKKDVLNWMPKLKQGGIMCGHDCDRHYTMLSDKERKLVDRNLEVDYISGLGHPGIMKALYELQNSHYIKVPGTVIWYFAKE